MINEFKEVWALGSAGHIVIYGFLFCLFLAVGGTTYGITRHRKWSAACDKWLLENPGAGRLIPGEFILEGAFERGTVGVSEIVAEVNFGGNIRRMAVPASLESFPQPIQWYILNRLISARVQSWRFWHRHSDKEKENIFVCKEW